MNKDLLAFLAPDSPFHAVYLFTSPVNLGFQNT